MKPTATFMQELSNVQVHYHGTINRISRSVTVRYSPATNRTHNYKNIYMETVSIIFTKRFMLQTDGWRRSSGVHCHIHKSHHQIFTSQLNLALVFTTRFSFDAMKWCRPRSETIFLDRWSCGHYIAVGHLSDLGLCDEFVFYYWNLMHLRSNCLSLQSENWIWFTTLRAEHRWRLKRNV